MFWRPAETLSLLPSPTFLYLISYPHSFFLAWCLTYLIFLMYLISLTHPASVSVQFIEDHLHIDPITVFGSRSAISLALFWFGPPSNFSGKKCHHQGEGWKGLDPFLALMENNAFIRVKEGWAEQGERQRGGMKVWIRWNSVLSRKFSHLV